MAAALLMGLAVMPTGLACAQDPAAPPEAGAIEPAPEQVRELLLLLDDPAVRDWLNRRAVQTAPPSDVGGAAVASAPQAYLAQRIEAIRAHLRALGAALPRLPQELERVGNRLSMDLEERGMLWAALLVALFAALGFGVQWLFLLATTGLRQRIIDAPLATVGERIRVVLLRFGYGVAMVLAFIAGSIGAFLLFEWPPLLRDIIIGYLIALLVLRLAFVFSRFLLAPGAERFRLVPMSTAAARFWDRRIGVAVGWFAFGWVTVALLASLGFDRDALRLVAYALGLVLLAIGLHVVWTRPRAEPAAADASAPGLRDRLRDSWTWLLSAWMVLLWLLWVASAGTLFWFAVVAVGLPGAMAISRRAVNHILRPPDRADGEVAAPPSVTAVALERGVRDALIIGAALLLVWGWGLDLTTLTAQDTFVTRLLRGLLNAVAIVLVADFAWHLLAAWIDRKLVEAPDPSRPDIEEVRRRARLRTLLPIMRNVLLIVLVTMAALMALSSLGIQIGPLIAGAGVVGVAIGFGAQTLVKDIISGMFYLLDDAFRVGEYIVSGSYKGTVESFSLRSIKLRHHRGSLYTVPFGELGAVQNMSRDWVIDKITVSVTYDTDLDQAKKIIKQVGKELAQAPDLAPHILETMKMQGVEQFGDFAIQLRMKMMTKPGEQFVIRRRAYAMIKKAFDANGIKFAFPTVTVAGGAEATPAVAHQAIEMTRPPPAAAE